MRNELAKFIHDQLSVWPLASASFRSLKSARTKSLSVGGIEVRAQHNPARLASSTAEVDEATIAARPCFLCEANRPKEQFHIRFDGRKERVYNIQVNPFPVLPDHLVIASSVHTPQSIWHHFVDMMDFARKYPEYLVFYNGPMSGASAPDHLHYQAVPIGMLPLQTAVDDFLEASCTPLATYQDARIYHFPHFCRGVYALEADTPKSLAKMFYRLVDCAPLPEGEDEPRLNLFTYCARGCYRAIVVLRGNLRSHHYFATGEDHLTMSPGAADMAGLFICPSGEDFDKLTAEMLEDMLDEVTISPEDEKMVGWRLTRRQPKINVPIAHADRIEFEMISDGAGPQVVEIKDGKISYGGVLYDELYFDSVTRSTLFAPASFVIYGPETLRYAGSLMFDVENGTIRAVNHIGIENLLLSIMSEELGKDLPEDEIKQKIIERRASILAGTLPEIYHGLSIEIINTVRQAVDTTWGLKTIIS